MLPDLADYRPKYKTIIPTTKKEIVYSPYIKNQEKSILIAAQEDDFSSLISTLENIIKECSNESINTIVDFSYLLTFIKAKSNGSEHTFSIPECKNPECDNKKIEVHVQDMLEHIQIKNEDKLKSVYKLTDDISIKLVPTKVDMLKEIKMENTPDNIEKQTKNLLIYSIDYVVFKDKIIKDFTKEELEEKIIKNLTPKQEREIAKEIDDLISVLFSIKYKCPKCGKEHTEEIRNFLFSN